MAFNGHGVLLRAIIDVKDDIEEGRLVQVLEDFPLEPFGNLYAEVMDNMYLPLEESYNGQRTWDVEQFEFEYTFMDIEEAAKYKGLLKRSDFIEK